MNDDTTEEIRALKRELRDEARRRLRSMSPEERARASAAIREHLAAEIERSGARRIAIFLSTASEPDLRPLADSLSATHELFAPRVLTGGGMEWRRLARWPAGIVRGEWNVDQPDPEANPDTAGLGDTDLILVPGTAFDAQGGRLGRGGGHFDRTLADAGPVRKIGVAFGAAVVKALPREAHDVVMDAVVTEGGMVGRRPGGGGEGDA